MLGQVNLNDKTYKDIFQQALNLIPVLTDEWSDHNYSDPGINAVQILSIVKLFQQAYVNRLQPRTQEGLLKLLGHKLDDIKPSNAKVKFTASENVNLVANTKITAGDVVFENNQATTITSAIIKKIFTFDNSSNKYSDVTAILLGNTRTATYPFGPLPSNGFAMYLIFDKPISSQIIHSLYIQIDSVTGKERNLLPKDSHFKLANLKWEYYSESGWKSISVNDNTHDFLQSGSIDITIDGPMTELYDENMGSGYMIRVVVQDSNYDMAPRIRDIVLNFTELVQKDTYAKSFVFASDGKDEQIIVLENFMTVYNRIVILGKDENGIYRRYTLPENHNNQGRFCYISNQFGRLEIIFSKKDFGVVPANFSDSIKIICYTTEFSNLYSSEKVYGFSDQIINIDKLGTVIGNEFKVMARVCDEDGEECFYECTKGNYNGSVTDGALEYRLDIINKTITISNVNISGDIDLLIVDCATSKGREGNIRQGGINGFINFSHSKDNAKGMMTYPSGWNSIRVKNICPVKDGKDPQTMDSVITQIMEGLNTVNTLVTKNDFEKKVLQVPGLSIHKVKASCAGNQNNISIIVKPHSDSRLPKLTETHKEAIKNYLDKYRLITTQIEIISPVYVPINVSGSIYIKPYYKDASQIIRDLIEKELDSVSSDKHFGQEIVYGDIYAKIEKLPCVEYVYSLSLDADSSCAKKQINSNISLDQNALSYMGEFKVEINNKIMTVI